MFYYKVRRLVLENTTNVLSDRVIVNAICDELIFLEALLIFYQSKQNLLVQ